MSVAECQRRVSSREFSTWIALAQIEPWHDTEYRAAAIIASTIANAFQVFSKRKKEVRIEDFMPNWEAAVMPELKGEDDFALEAKPEGDVDALLAKSMAVFMRFPGGFRDLSKDKKPN